MPTWRRICGPRAPASAPRARRHVGVAVTLWMFGYMVVVHANRFLYEVPQPWDGSQMVLTLKLSALALNFADGRLAATERPPHLKRTVHLAVRETPSLLEYFGYVYCFLCFHAGPMIEFRDYMRFMASSAVEEVRAPRDRRLPLRTTDPVPRGGRPCPRCRGSSPTWLPPTSARPPAHCPPRPPRPLKAWQQRSMRSVSGPRCPLSYRLLCTDAHSTRTLAGRGRSQATRPAPSARGG